MSKQNNYKAKNGKTLKGYQYKKGDESGICEKHNKPFIYQDGRKIYVTEEDVIFIMDGEKKINVLNADLFYEKTTLID